MRSKSELVVTVKRVEEFLVLRAGGVGRDEMFRITKVLRGPLANRSSPLPFIHCHELAFGADILGFILRKTQQYLCLRNSICSRHNMIFPLFEKDFFLFFLVVTLLSSMETLFQTNLT